MNQYTRNVILYLITIAESVINLFLSLIGLYNYTVTWSMSWLVYCTCKDYEKHEKQRISFREAKEREAKELAQLSINIANGQDIQKK